MIQNSLSKSKIREDSGKFSNHFFLGKVSTFNKSTSSKISNPPSSPTKISKIEGTNFKSEKCIPKKFEGEESSKNIPMSVRIHTDFEEKKEVMRRVESNLATDILLKDLVDIEQINKN